MEDVHMEEAEAATPGQGSQQQQPSAAPSSAAAPSQATPPTHPATGDASATPAGQRELSNATTSASHTLAGAVDPAASSHEAPDSSDSSRGMDIDTSAADHVKMEDTNKHPNVTVQPSSNGAEHGDDKSARPALTQPTAPASSASSVAMVDTQVDPAPGSAMAEAGSTPAADAEDKTTTAAAPPTGAADTPADAAEVLQAAKPESSPAPPIRTYIPQFKFTTFTAMAPLPTRNVTSNFLKTDKNYVLKDMSERQRRRKRKAGDHDDAAGLAVTEMTEAEAQDKKNSQNAEGGDGGNELLSKKKRDDDFSAIRKGIFADDGLDLEDDSTPKKDQDEDEEGVYSSDSDSEASVVNEMDENGETKS
ncbi:hypothetical protein BGZ70_008776, partial [Mortierella alpina]